MNIIIIPFDQVIYIFKCDADSESSDTDTAGDTADIETTESDKAETTVEESKIMDGAGVIDDYAITIKSCTLSSNYEDAPSVIITYDFTNNSEKAQSFIFAVSAKVFQDGIECDTTISNMSDDSYNSENQMKEIKTGATLEVQAIYKLNNSTSDIEVEVSELFSFDDNPSMIVKTFSLS